MRPAALIVLILFVLCAVPPLCPAAQAQAPRKTPAGKAPTKKKPPSGNRRGRFLIPGVGGAIPPRGGPRKPVVPAAPDFRALFGAPNLPLPGQGPAAVAVPGQGPGLPGLPQTGASGVPDLQARPVSPLLYGVNAVWGDSGGGANWDRGGGAKARRLAQLMKTAGVTNTRIGIGWADVEKTRGKYDWRATDRFINYVSGLGVTLICVVATTPDWALDNTPEVRALFRERRAANLAGVRPPKPEFYADLGRFAYACAQRYRDRIHHWEFWNEPDGMGMPFVIKNAQGQPVDIRYGGDPKVYTDLLKVFSHNVKRADPTARVAVGGLQVQKTDFLAGIYANGGRVYFDAVALHPYRERDAIAFDWIDRGRNLLVSKGDAAKTFWLTEWGWATGGANGLNAAQQARLIRESMAGMRTRPFITQASYHTLNDWRTREGDPASLVTMGLTTDDLKPRPGYFAFREMATGAPAGPSRLYARVNLTGGLPVTGESGVRGSSVVVTVDAGQPGAPLAPFWAGFTQGSVSDSPGFFAETAPHLRALGARLVRFDPFPNPDVIRSEGAQTAGLASSPLPPFAPSQVDWRYADMMVETVTRAGAKPMLSFSTMPTVLSSPEPGRSRLPRDPEAWAAFVQAAVHRYNGEQKRGVVYWELAGVGDLGADGLRLYDTFARAVLAADPAAKVGGTGESAEAARALAEHCAQDRVPLHFVSWRAYGLRPEEYAQQARALRAALSRLPALKDVELVLAEWNASARPAPEQDSLVGAAYAASVVEALADAGPLRALFYEVREGPDFRRPAAVFNGRWGVLTHDFRPKPVYNTFHFLRGMEGLRLRAESEDGDIHALAVRRPDRVAVLVWSNPRPQTAGPDTTAGTPPPDTPVRLRVRGLPWAGGARGELRMMDMAHGGALDRPNGTRPVQAVFRAPAGDPEIPVVLPSGGMALVELSPPRPSPIELTLDTPDYVVYGGSSFPVSATLRNTTGQAQAMRLDLASTDAALVPAAQRSRPITVPPGAPIIVHLTLRAPASATETQEFVRAMVRSAAGRGPMAESAIAVRFATPLQVRLEPERADTNRPGAPPDSAAATARIRVMMENRSDAPLRTGLVAGNMSQTVTVPARSMAAVPISLSAPADVPGNYAVPVRVLLGDRVVATPEAVVGVPALCRYAARTPRINGDLSEWSDAYALTPTAPSKAGEKPWGGPDDLSAQAFAMWDERFLYIAAAVTDDTHFQPFAPEDMARGDSLLLALDARRNAVPGRESYDADDYEFGISSGRLRAVAYRFAGDGRPAGPVTTAQAAIQRVGNRTLYEAAIPWAEIALMRPRAGAAFGFSLRINDSDGQGPGFIEWAGGLGASKNPGRFIAMRLVKE